jgi:hypothetical protein
MVAVRVDIWNIALLRIGENDQLVEEEQEERPASEACLKVYDNVLKRALEAYHWSFAKKQSSISQHATATREGWEYVYALPTDCITPLALLMDDVRIGLQTRDEREPYEIVKGDTDGERYLLSDLDDDDFEKLEYICFNQHVPDYSSEFISAVAWLLASELALALTKDLERHKVCLQMYQMDIATAAAQDKNRQQEDTEQSTPSVDARGG